MILACIQNNLVTAIFLSNSEEETQSLSKQYQAVIDVTDQIPQPKVGWVFDGQFVKETLSDAPSKKITKLAFLNRLTMTELAGFYTAASSNVIFQIIKDKLQVATYIDLSRPDTQQALGAMVQASILTPQRYSEILNNEIQDIEKYRG